MNRGSSIFRLPEVFESRVFVAPAPFPIPHSLNMLTTSNNLVNFTKLNWEHEFLSGSDPGTSNESLHHTLISIFLLESAVIYISASLLLQSFERDDAIYQQLSIRTIRFSAVSIIDACTILIHKIVVNVETQTLYPLRLDTLLLMCLNLLLFICML